MVGSEKVTPPVVGGVGASGVILADGGPFRVDSLTQIGAGGSRVPGLVHSVTSDPRNAATLLVEVRSSRLSRMKRSVLTASRLMTQGLERGGFRVRCWFETLTYADADGWEGRDISRYLHARRQWARRQGVPLRYVWVAELQKRGAPHYHVLFWLPRQVALPKADKRGIWRQGMTRREIAHKPVGYIAKYASKHESKGSQYGELPKGMRMHGRGGMSPAQRVICSWWLLPGFVREAGGSEHRWTRAKGGGFLSRLTGEVLESGWRFSGCGDGYVRLIYCGAIPRPVYRFDPATIPHLGVGPESEASWDWPRLVSYREIFPPYASAPVAS